MAPIEDEAKSSLTEQSLNTDEVFESPAMSGMSHPPPHQLNSQLVNQIYYQSNFCNRYRWNEIAVFLITGWHHLRGLR